MRDNVCFRWPPSPPAPETEVERLRRLVDDLTADKANALGKFNAALEQVEQLRSDLAAEQAAHAETRKRLDAEIAVLHKQLELRRVEVDGLRVKLAEFDQFNEHMRERFKEAQAKLEEATQRIATEREDAARKMHTAAWKAARTAKRPSPIGVDTLMALAEVEDAILALDIAKIAEGQRLAAAAQSAAGVTGGEG